MAKKGLILVNAYAPEPYTRGVKRFIESFAALGVRAEVRRNDFFPLSVTGGGVKSRLPDCDFCLYLDKDKYVARLIEASGIRLFNSARAIELCDDKMTTHIALAGTGIPMPDTIPGLLCYDNAAEVSDETVRAIGDRLGYPVVVKTSYGSLGKGVFKADDFNELKALCEKVKLNSHLFQKFVAASAGRDMRVIVIGGKTIGAIIRQSDGDFRSNIGLGGHAEKTPVPKKISDVAELAAKTLGLDYCGIDFLLDGDTALLCEVNSNAFFDAFERATGIDVALLYAEHILKTIS